MLALIVLALLGTVIAEDASSQTKDAFVLASKNTVSMFAVEDKEFVVSYNLYNTGDKPAIKVLLDDRASFPTQNFESVKGLLNVRFESIAPGSHVTHTVVLKPRTIGAFNQSAALVTYYSEGVKDQHIGYTNVGAEGYVYRLKDYERKFASKYPYWFFFAILVAPTTLGSLYAFLKSKKKYEELAKKKN